jgi:iron complex transport system substrate-binding protein
MTRSIARLRTGLLLALLVTWGCAPDGGAGTGERETAASGPGVALTDDAGRNWSLDHPPERVVSLVPSATLLLLELGHGHRLAGRTDFDEDPRIADLPSVGGGLGPSLEVLLSLRPDLVVRFEGPSDPETPRRLDQAGIPHLALRLDRVEDILRAAYLLDEALGPQDTTGEEPPRSEVLVRDITTTLEEVAMAVSGAARPRVGILLGGDPPWMASGDTYMGQVVSIAGGDNVFADEPRLYAPMSVEEVLRRRPEVLLLTEGARIPPALRGIPVLRAPAALGKPGPDIGSTAWAVARLLHPERVP